MAEIEVRHIDGHLLASVNADPIADFTGLDLRGANLRGMTLRTVEKYVGKEHGWLLWKADLREADLRYSDLRYCNFREANLTGVDLSGSDLRTCNFHKATLNGARFDGARIPWCSHDVLAAILRNAANGDPAKIASADYVIGHRDWTWEQFIASNYPMHGWNTSILKGYVQPGDNAPPHLV
jgi:hypothetical protein